MFLKTLSLGLLFLSVAGCSNDRYELAAGDGGRVIRLDKQTGEMVAVEDGIGIPILTNTETEEESSFDSYETWSTTVTNDEVQVFMMGRWEAGVLEYQITVEPVPDSLPTPTAARVFTARLNDSFGFNLVEIPINRGEMTRVLGQDGEATSLELKSRVAFTRSQFERSRDGTLRMGWHF